MPCEEISLPDRFRGGLLFGQLVPRFENRIIARCPITWEAVYQQSLQETGDEEKAKETAEKKAKVPNAECTEFYRYRWAMQVANVLVAANTPREFRRLTVTERRTLDEKMRARGAFTKGEFRKEVRALTGGRLDNLDQMLMHSDADKALVTNPVQRLLVSDELAPFLAVLPESLHKRASGRLRRDGRISLGQIRAWLPDAAAIDAFETAVRRRLDAENTKKGKMTPPLTREDLIAKPWRWERLSGRAPHSREVTRTVADFVFSTDRHPAKADGPLSRSEAIRNAQLQRAIDEQTNNHLVRHRLRLLERLHCDLLAEPRFGGGDKERVAKITIEVNRELREFSGKTAKEIAQDLGLRLGNFKRVQEKLEAALAGSNLAITSGLIRKARIAEDLDSRQRGVDQLPVPTVSLPPPDLDSRQSAAVTHTHTFGC